MDKFVLLKNEPESFSVIQLSVYYTHARRSFEPHLLTFSTTSFTHQHTEAVPTP